VGRYLTVEAIPLGVSGQIGRNARVSTRNGPSAEGVARVAVLAAVSLACAGARHVGHDGGPYVGPGPAPRHRGVTSMPFDYLQVPVFIVCRDKLSPLLELVRWLERHRYQRVVLVDNASTYPPLLDYFNRTDHDVHRLTENLGPYKSIWSSGVLEQYARDNYFVVTDCDVIPMDACPGDAVGYFHWALRRFPSFVKAGFGLCIDDLPRHFELAENVRSWEEIFWRRRFSHNLYQADIDTTFALYRPGSPFQLSPAIRTGKPYLARHQPWYIDSLNRTEEERYYRDHCDPKMAHWDLGGHPMRSKKTADPLVKAKAKAVRRKAKALMEDIQWQAHVLRDLPRDPTVSRRYHPEAPSQHWA